MQIFIYCKVTLHVSCITAPIIRSIKNCNRSLRYRSYYLYRYSPPTWSDRDGVTPEICRVVLQWINICILLHLLGFYSHWITMHGTTTLQVYQLSKHAFAPNIFSPLEHVGYYVYSLLKVINVRIFPTDFMYGLHFIAWTNSNDFPNSFNLLHLSPKVF